MKEIKNVLKNKGKESEQKAKNALWVKITQKDNKLLFKLVQRVIRSQPVVKARVIRV